MAVSDYTIHPIKILAWYMIDVSAAKFNLPRQMAVSDYTINPIKILAWYMIDVSAAKFIFIFINIEFLSCYRSQNVRINFTSIYL